MAEHVVDILWKGAGDGVLRGEYSRAHEWRFDGGVVVPASPSPSVVRAPWSDPSAVDPEEAFVAAIASCHMLSFLYVASKAGFVVDSYADHAVGTMTKNEARVPWVSRVELRPRIAFGGERRPNPDEVARLHERAHHECFIANSVKTEIVLLPTS